jgi:hypothetical protein
MDISAIITVVVIIAFAAYLISSVRSFNRVHHRAQYHGPKQVVESLFKILDSDVKYSKVQAVPDNSDLPDELLALATDIRLALSAFAMVEGYGGIPLEVSCHERFVDENGDLTHYIVIVHYTTPKDQVVTTLLHVDASRLTEHVIQADAHVRVLHTMVNAG